MGDWRQTRWTEADLEAMRTHYPEGGAPAVKPHLSLDRSLGAIGQQALKMGLKAPSRQKYPRDAETDEKIRQGWASMTGKRRGEVQALADALGVPRHWLTARALALGLSMPRRKEPDWSAAEDALLAALPLHDPRRCSALMRERGYDRAPSAIVSRAHRLHINRRAAHETLSARAAATILGVDGKTLSEMCARGDIAASKFDDARTAAQGGSRWSIEPAVLRDFVVRHPECIDFRKVDKFALVDLLARPRPPRPRPSPVAGWTDEKRARARRLVLRIGAELSRVLNVPMGDLVPIVRDLAAGDAGARRLPEAAAAESEPRPPAEPEVVFGPGGWETRIDLDADAYRSVAPPEPRPDPEPAEPDAGEAMEVPTSVQLPAVTSRPARPLKRRAPVPNRERPVAAPPRKPAAGRRYRLEAAPGVWLHQSCETTTADRPYRWEGTGSQLDAVRRKFPFTRKFKAVEVIAP